MHIKQHPLKLIFPCSIVDNFALKNRPFKAYFVEKMLTRGSRVQEVQVSGFKFQVSSLGGLRVQEV